MSLCACGSRLEYSACCEPFLSGSAFPTTAEALMRSRYTAFTRCQVEYILETVHPDNREKHDPTAIRDWAKNSKWLGLEIMATEAGGPEDETGSVEFLAKFIERSESRRHHELAHFRKHEGRWYFYDGAPPAVRQIKRESPKLGRNDPCSCGSGKKFKKCCG